MEENLHRKEMLYMFNILGVLASMLNALVNLARLVMDIRKDKKQESNRRSLPKE